MMSNLYDSIHEWLVQHLVLPICYQMGWMNFSDDADLVVDWIFLGLLQLLIISLILRPLEKNETHYFSSKEDTQENWSKDQHAAIRVDIFYSTIHRLGIYQFFFFYCFSGIFFFFTSELHDIGFERMNVENWLPNISSIPVVSFIIYLILFDLLDYVYHRLSHRFGWWWQLHAMHHSQQHMTAWSDNRNHLLDDVMRSIVFALFALWIGVEPSQYLLLIVSSRLIQSWQHGFYPYDFGILKYLIVTPSFHRYHHAIGLGYELPGKPGVLGGCNFGVLFPWWDIFFGTAQFDRTYYPTGVKGFNPPNHFLAQQWFGLKKSWQALVK
jgi:sterol desaturase/sphingolipid hydroxylase (fatty acid hydroxylase superfamily)